MTEVDITGLDPAAVLAALYNNAKIQGKGVRDPRGSMSLSVDDARDYLQRSDRFDYVQGRVLKVDLSAASAAVDVRLYDRDNGAGRGAWVIEHLRATGSTEEII